jgi:hypothetical protein
MSYLGAHAPFTTRAVRCTPRTSLPPVGWSGAFYSAATEERPLDNVSDRALSCFGREGMKLDAVLSPRPVRRDARVGKPRHVSHTDRGRPFTDLAARRNPKRARIRLNGRLAMGCKALTALPGGRSTPHFLRCCTTRLIGLKLSIDFIFA